MKILDPEFNRVVLEMSKQVQYYVSDHEYESFDDMKTSFEKYGYLLINRDNSENTIFGVPYINHAFRAWHDYCHILGGYDFSLSGELVTSQMQCAQMADRFPDHPKLGWWNSILDCEVFGQASYFLDHNEFPSNQYEFALGYLGLEG